MANHKKRKPKNARAGCGLCYPHKRSGVGKRAKPGGDRRREEGSLERIAQHDHDLAMAQQGRMGPVWPGWWNEEDLFEEIRFSALDLTDDDIFVLKIQDITIELALLDQPAFLPGGDMTFVQAQLDFVRGHCQI